MRLISECSLGDSFERAELFGDGVGIWNGSRQLEISEAEVTGLLELLERSRFAEMRQMYGEAEEEEIPIPQDAAPDTEEDRDENRHRDREWDEVRFVPRVVCHVTLRIGEVEKQSVQLERPPHSERLADLAEEIFDRLRPAGEAGTPTESLDDGLAKIAAGTLAPQTLSVLIQRKPEPSELAAGAEGFLLRIDGGRTTVRRLEANGGYGPPRSLDLDDAAFAALAGDLAEAKIGEVPLNLWAEHYTDLTVRVLSYERQIQARRFTRMTKATHGEAQVRYDRVYRELVMLAEPAEH